MSEKLHFHKDGTHTKCENWDVCIETGNKELILEIVEDLRELKEVSNIIWSKISKWENKL